MGLVIGMSGLQIHNAASLAFLLSWRANPGELFLMYGDFPNFPVVPGEIDQPFLGKSIPAAGCTLASLCASTSLARPVSGSNQKGTGAFVPYHNRFLPSAQNGEIRAQGMDRQKVYRGASIERLTLSAND
jgi:hypothetical protein